MKKKLVLVVAFLITFNLIFSKEKLKIGVIYDNESYVEFINLILEEEFEKNFEGTSYNPVVQETVVVEDEADFFREMKRMERNNNIDVIMAMGVLSSELTLQESSRYQKLVIAPFGMGENLKKIKNLRYITEPLDIIGDIEFVSGLKEVEKVSFLMPNVYKVGYLKNKIDSILEGVEKAGYEINMLCPNEAMETTNNRLEDTDLVYMFESDYPGLEKVIEKANEKKIMTFSRATGNFDEGDILMAYDNTPEASRRIRASVVNILRTLEGDRSDEIVTNLGRMEKEIRYNSKVGRNIGVYPDVVFAQKVRFINLERNQGKKLGYIEGINEALANNPDLESTREDIITDEYNLKSAKSGRRPNLSAFAEYTRLDDDTASSVVTSAENTVDGGISLNYIIFDDSINSSVDQGEYQVLVREALYEQERLDTIQDYATAYLTILEQNANLEVQIYNYELNREYLQIAETKYEVGAAGPEDIYRLQSEISTALTSIADSESQIRIAEASLNKVLNNPMSYSYNLEEVDVKSKSFKDIGKILKDGNSNLNGLRSFFIDEGIRNAPEIGQLENQVLAKERELKAAKRERYMPTLTATGEWSDDLTDDWGTGSGITSGGDSWSIGAKAELPLYSGGNIGYTKSRVNSELKSLESQMVSLESEISSGISSNFSEVLKDYISITTTKEAAEAARKNLELIEDFYAKGTTSISDLLDARTSFISSDQLEVAARYSYLKSLVNLERSVGEYLVMMDGLEKQARIEELKDYLSVEKGVIR